MKVALIFPYYSEQAGLAEEILNAYPIVRCLPPSMTSRSHNVRVFVQAAETTSRIVETTPYEFVAAHSAVRAVARAAFRWRKNLGPAYYEPINALVNSVARFQPDIVHFFGLTMDLQLAQVARFCRRHDIPLVVHFHGGLPSTGRRRVFQQHNLSRVDRVLFTTREQAQPWIEYGLLPGWESVETVMETSSAFSRLPRSSASQETSMTGNPVCLSVGRLHPIKDPITMLRGFSRFAEHAPDARLYCYFLTDEMIDEVREILASSHDLSQKVELRGRAAPETMPAIYSSADILLQSSTREWSGLAILEAMSCGCIPVVTDIPSFRAMTEDSRYGCHFPVGDEAALARALLDVHSGKKALTSAGVEEHFRANLSFDAMAERLDSIYRELRTVQRIT